MKKTFAILLCAVLVLGALSGCGAEIPTASMNPTAEPTVEPTVEPTAEPTEVSGHDWDAAYALFAPETIVMTADGSDVTWGEYFYWLYYAVSYVEQYIGTVTDFDAECAVSEGETWAEYFDEAALNMVKQYHALEVNADRLGISLTDEDEAELEALHQDDVSYTLGEDATDEEFFEYLAEIYVSPELYEYMNEISVLYSRVQKDLYGENGEKYTDEQALAYAEENGYLSAKHILLKTVDDDNNALSDEEKAEKLATAEDILAQINAAGAAEREAKFDELMKEYTEDTGLVYYPDGYCFTPGTMVTEFEDAVRALGDGEVSDIVESSYGYHIIMRLPLSPESIVEYDSYGTTAYTLRYIAAMTEYQTRMNGWMTAAEIIKTPELEAFDMNAVLGVEEATE